MSTCFAQAEQILRRELTKEEKDRIKGVVKRVITKGMGPDDLDAAVVRAVDEHMDEVLTASLAEKRNTFLNKRKTEANMDWLETNFEDDPGAGLIAMLVGSWGTEKGTRNHVAGWMASLNDQWRDTLLVDLERLGEGTREILKSGEMDTAVRKAIKAMDRNEPLTDMPPIAVKIAQVMRNHLEKVRLRANQAGANIAKRDGYAGVQSHDQMKILKAGQETWTAFMKAELDLDETFGFTDPDMVDDALAALYTRFSSGVHARFENDPSGGLKGPRNIAASMGHQRSLVFRSSEAETRYSNEYGKGTLLENMVRQTETMAQNTGIMERLGPNADMNLERIITETQKKLELARDAKGQALFAKRVSRIRDAIWPTVNGAAQIPGNALVAQRFSIFRSILSWAKLGGSTLSAISDIPIAASAHRFQGRGMFSGMADQITGMFKGFDDIDRREALAAMGVGIDGFTTRIASRFAPEDTMHGWLVKANNTYYRWNLLTPWTDRQTATFAMSTSAGWATHVNSQWDAVPEAWQRIMRIHGIEDTEWEAIRMSDTRTLEGDDAALLTAEAVEALDDEIIDQYLSSQGRALTNRNRADARTSLGGKVRTLFQDQAANAVVKPGAKTRATLLQGKAPGTPTGEIWRSFAQFKMFPVGVLQGPMAREWFGYGEVGRINQIRNIARLMMYNAAFGYMAMSLKDIAKGREPRVPDTPGEFAKTLMASMAQGGGAGIYGDFLFGDMKNRFGGNAISTFMGPTFGFAGDIVDLAQRVRDGDDVAAKATSVIINNTPGLNLFYVRAALDYAFIYELKELMNPGYLKRMERRVKDENDQVFMYPPSQHVR